MQNSNTEYSIGVFFKVKRVFCWRLFVQTLHSKKTFSFIETFQGSILLKFRTLDNTLLFYG